MKPFDARYASWKFLGGILALLLVMFAVTHRLRSGTWAWDAEEWVPLLLGLIAGLVLSRIVILWFARRQQARIARQPPSA